MCESNTPETFCVPRNGFEDRGTHQESIRPHLARAHTLYRHCGLGDLDLRAYGTSFLPGADNMCLGGGYVLVERRLQARTWGIISLAEGRGR